MANLVTCKDCGVEISKAAKACPKYVPPRGPKISIVRMSQYAIAKRGSNPIQTCIQAGMVLAAYLQAKDEANVHKWQAIEKVECELAGMPR